MGLIIINKIIIIKGFIFVGDKLRQTQYNQFYKNSAIVISRLMTHCTVGYRYVLCSYIYMYVVIYDDVD